MSKMRIAFVTPIFGQITNGPGLYVRNLWKMFSDDREVDFHVVALESDREHPQIHVPVKAGGRGSVYRRLESWTGECCRRLGSSTIAHFNSAHLVRPPFLDQLHRTIVQVNDMEVCQWRLSVAGLRQAGLRRNAALCWRRQRERKAVHTADVTVCNSVATYESVVAAYRLDRARAKMIYKAVPLQPFREPLNLKREVPIRGRRRIVFVGTNWQAKGLDVLVNAAAVLQSRRPSAYEVMVYGQPVASRQMDRIAAQIKRLRLESVVQLRGHIGRHALPQVLADAAVFVLPSRSEALGVAAIEALATGVPVVASRVGGLPEVVDDPICGSLFAVGDAQQLAESIERTIDGDSLQSRIQRSQRMDRFDLLPLEQALRRLYRELNDPSTAALSRSSEDSPL